MKEQDRPYFEIITTNHDRAAWIASVLPSKKAQYIGWSPVDEDTQKQFVGRPDELVAHIAAYKVQEDFKVFDSQALAVLYRGLAERGFTHLVTIASDTIRVVHFEDYDLVQHKPTLTELASLPRLVSGQSASILTAISQQTVCFESREITRSTVTIDSRFQYTPFTSEEFWKFAGVVSLGKILGTSGAIPIDKGDPNPLVAWDRGITVTLFDRSGATVIAQGNVEPERCVHGAFPVVIDALLGKSSSIV